MSDAPLKNGYYELPPGKLANVVTCLEMTARPPARGRGFGPGFELVPGDRTDLAKHRALFSKVGRDLMWFSRLIMEDAKLAAILGDPDYSPFVLRKDGVDAGMLDLDFRAAGQCELAFFGLAPEFIGGGAGRALMEQAITLAWAKPIKRFWVHTCSFDHPAALAFYQRSGFKPYQIMVEVHDDPRLTGHMPRDATPQAPLIDG
jgi:GNAT superfamily N-acetyltransferase